MSYKPEPGSIVAQTEDHAPGLTTLTLSNGVTVVLKPTDFSKDLVQMMAVRPGGRNTFTDAEQHTARFASVLQGAMGAGSYSPSELQRNQARIGAELAGAQGQRCGVGGADRSRARGQRVRQQRQRIDAAHFGIHGYRFRPALASRFSAVPPEREPVKPTALIRCSDPSL